MQLLHKFLYIICFLCTLLFGGCGGKKHPFFSANLPGYDLSRPVTIHLNSEMDEISGINFYPKDTSIFCITDEVGMLYKIIVRNKVFIQKWKFSGKEDYEDLCLVDSTFFALKSDGGITGFRFFTRDSLQLQHYEPPFEGKNEFETLYYDVAQQMLVLICKNCGSDERNFVTAFAFDPLTSQFVDTPYFVMDVKPVAQQLGRAKLKFKASAAAIHPLSKDLYILSSVNKVLVVANRNGEVKMTYTLNPAIFKQPEGIAFTPKGDLLISNESAEVGSANILIFKYKVRTDGKG